MRLEEHLGIEDRRASTNRRHPVPHRTGEDLEPTVEVLLVDAKGEADHEVVDTTHKGAIPGIGAPVADPGDHIRTIERGEQHTEVVGRELAVAIHEREHFPSRRTEPVADGAGVATLLSVGDDRQVLGVLAHGRACRTDGVVLARIVHEDDLVCPATFGQHRHDVLEDPPDVLRLVVGGNREADVDLG